MLRRILLLLCVVGCGGGEGGGGPGGEAGVGGSGGDGGGPSCEAAAVDCCATGEALAPTAPGELHELLHGRWQICGGAVPGAPGAEGVEFRDGAFWQLLRLAEQGGALIGDPDNMGWQIDVADVACGYELTLFRSMGGKLVAEARVHDGALRLDFETGTACFVSVR
jgi:hypothetical protein